MEHQSLKPKDAQWEAFSFFLWMPIRWGDMDAFQHVNNTVFLQYFESARIEYFEKTGIMTSGVRPQVGPILSSLSCRFRAPLRYPDSLCVGVRAHSLQEDRFEMEYLLWSQALQTNAAKGSSCIVVFDYESNQKASLPLVWKQGIQRIEEAQ